MIDRYSNKTSSIRQQNTKWKHTCSKRSNVQPKNANHRKTYRVPIFVGIGGIVPVNSFDAKYLKERTCAWEAMNQKNENAMKRKQRNTTLQRAKFNNSTSDQQITRIARLMESKGWSLLVDCCSNIYFSSQFLRNCANETSRNAKHSENKHRVKFRETNELWDRPSEQVRIETTRVIWKRRASAKKEENARKQETFEQTKKYWNFIDKTKNDTKTKIPTKFNNTANHREITECKDSARQQMMEWIQSSYCSRERYNVSATAIAPINEWQRTKSHKQSESANVLSSQRVQIRKVECRDRSSKSLRRKIAEWTNRERKKEETMKTSQNTKNQSRAYVHTR